MKEVEIFHYHSPYRGDKKSRYTVSGIYINEGEKLKMAYCRRSTKDNFSKEYGRTLSSDRLFTTIPDTAKFIKIVDTVGRELTRNTFILEAKNFIQK